MWQSMKHTIRSGAQSLHLYSKVKTDLQLTVWKIRTILATFIRYAQDLAKRTLSSEIYLCSMSSNFRRVNEFAATSLQT